MAEGLFRALAGENSGIAVASAGLSAAEGHPPSDFGVEVLREEGLDISDQASQQLTPELVEQSTHIFTMTQSHKLAIESLMPAAAEKTFLLREFTDDAAPDLASEGLLDVPDPIGQDRSAYQITRDLIKAALPGVLRFVRKTGHAPSP
jgi:protein-tyrosine phosphatase